MSKKIVYRRPEQIDKYPKQKFFVESRTPQLFCMGGTKSGKTVAMIFFCIEFAIELDAKNIKNANIWWIAPTYPVARIAMKRLWGYIPNEYKAFFKKNEHEKYIEFPKGIRIWFKSGEHPDRLYGEDVYAVVIDEASRVSEDVLDASVSVLTATNGLFRAIGNLKGKNNWFYRLCELAKAEEAAAKQARKPPKRAYMELTSADNPKITQESLEKAKSTLSDKKFKELYYNILPEDGDRAFPDDLLESCLIEDLSEKPAMFFGVDIGKVTDYTVIIGLDEDFNLAYFDRFKGKNLSNTTIAKRIVKAVKTDKMVLTYIDGTGIYNVIADSVQREVGNRKCKIIYIGGSNYLPTNGRYSRQHELERLQTAMQHGYLRFPQNVLGHGEVIYEEFASMLIVDTNEYRGKTGGEKIEYQAPKGRHDDIVMACAMAVKCAMKAKRIKLSNFPDQDNAT